MQCKDPLPHPTDGPCGDTQKECRAFCCEDKTCDNFYFEVNGCPPGTQPIVGSTGYHPCVCVHMWWRGARHHRVLPMACAIDPACCWRRPSSYVFALQHSCCGGEIGIHSQSRAHHMSPLCGMPRWGRKRVRTEICTWTRCTAVTRPVGRSTWTACEGGRAPPPRIHVASRAQSDLGLTLVSVFLRSEAFGIDGSGIDGRPFDFSFSPATNLSKPSTPLLQIRKPTASISFCFCE